MQAQCAFDSFLWMPPGAGETPLDESASRATLVGLLRYAIDGWTIEDALAEGKRINRGGPLSPQQVTWLLGWAATHAPGSERLNACPGQ